MKIPRDVFIIKFARIKFISFLFYSILALKNL